MRLALKSVEDLGQFVEKFASGLFPDTIVLLEGPMGAGKTQFVKLLCAALGSIDVASSPSFSLHNRYLTSEWSIDHLDLFRLKDESDLESSGFWDLFEPKVSGLKRLVLVEWADRLREWNVCDSLPKSWKMSEIEFSFVDGADGERRVTVR